MVCTVLPFDVADNAMIMDLGIDVVVFEHNSWESDYFKFGAGCVCRNLLEFFTTGVKFNKHAVILVK